MKLANQRGPLTATDILPLAMDKSTWKLAPAATHIMVWERQMVHPKTLSKIPWKTRGTLTLIFLLENSYLLELGFQEHFFRKWKFARNFQIKLAPDSPLGIIAPPLSLYTMKHNFILRNQ